MISLDESLELQESQLQRIKVCLCKECQVNIQNEFLGGKNKATAGNRTAT